MDHWVALSFAASVVLFGSVRGFFVLRRVARQAETILGHERKSTVITTGPTMLEGEGPVEA